MYLMLRNITVSHNIAKSAAGHSLSLDLVPEAGVEPAHLSAGDFKSPVSTISPPGH